MGRRKGAGSNLSNDEKLALCEYAAQHSSLSQKELCAWAQRTFDLARAPSQSTISGVLKKRDALHAMVTSELAVKRQRVLKHPELDRALANWALYTIQQSNQTVTGNAIKKKAARFAALLYPAEEGAETTAAELNFSNGWLDSFRERHGIKGLKRSKEKELVERSLPDLQELTAMYNPRDIYNFDEFGLFYDMSPDRTLHEAEVKPRRLALAVCVNADGSDRIEPLFVGRVKQPRSFKGHSAHELGFRYESNQKGCTNELVFQKWLQKFDIQMRDEGRNVLLLLDTASSHVVTGLTFEHVNLAFLPPHGIAQLQPLNAGIIAAFKRRYRRMHLGKSLERQEQGGASNIYAADQRRAMEWSRACWADIPDETIQHCWQRTRILGGDMLSAAQRRKSEHEQGIEDDIGKHIQWLRVANPMTVDEVLSPEAEDNIHAGVEDEDFVACAIEKECESEPEREEESGDDDTEQEHKEDEDVCETQPPLSNEEKLQHITQVLRFLEEHNCQNSTGRDLRKVQRTLRDAIFSEKRQLGRRSEL